MSDVERILCDDSEIAQSTSEPNKFLAEAMNKIMDSYVASAFQPDDLPAVMGSFIANTCPSTEDNLVMEQNVNDDVELAEILSSNQSEYSFMTDAFVPDIRRDVAFYIDQEVPTDNAEVYESLRTATVEETKVCIAINSLYRASKTTFRNINETFKSCFSTDEYRKAKKEIS